MLTLAGLKKWDSKFWNSECKVASVTSQAACWAVLQPMQHPGINSYTFGRKPKLSSRHNLPWPVQSESQITTPLQMAQGRWVASCHETIKQHCWPRDNWLCRLTIGIPLCFKLGSNKSQCRWHTGHEILDSWLTLLNPLRSLEQPLHTEFATLSWNAVWIRLLPYHTWAKRSMQPVVKDFGRTWWAMWHSCQLTALRSMTLDQSWEPASQQACRSHHCLLKPIFRPWWAWQTVSKQVMMISPAPTVQP